MRINDLPLNKDFEGYLWLSNSNKPKVFPTENVDIVLKEDMMPFVVEGQLYDSTTCISYSIRYVDGKYLVYKNDIDPTLLNLGVGNQKSITLKDKEGEDVTCIVERKDYLSNRMDGKWLTFLRYWEPTEDGDENCKGMKPLVITKNVFIGFKK